MHSYFVFILALHICVGLSLGCSSAPTAVPQMSGPVRIVNFPEPWVKLIDGHWIGVNDTPGYVVRKSAQGNLLFAVKQGFAGELWGKETAEFPIRHADYDYYSDNRYTVSVNGPATIRKITEAEWNAADKPVHSYYLIHSYENPQVTADSVKYNERVYRKSGESWGTTVALVSRRHTWIAIFSYSSREKPAPTLIPGLGGNKEPGHGEVFLDVYNVSSGEKIITARSPYGGEGAGFEPSMLFGESFWVEDRYLIMPLNWWLESCFVGVLPER